MKPSREELEAEILEYRHALEAIAESHADACPSCQIVAKSALGGFNREDFLALVREQDLGPRYLVKMIEPISLTSDDEEDMAQLLKRGGRTDGVDIPE